MESRRPSNRRIASAIGWVAFAVVAALLGLGGAAVALLDPGPTAAGRGPLPAIAAIAGASAIVGIAARFLALLVLKRIRPGGV